MWSVVGHEGAVLALSKAVEQGRMSHAYLFLGPKGVGKMHLALNLAQALNCTAERKPCGACAQCKRTISRRHADVQVIGLPKSAEGAARKTIPIDDIKDMQQSAGLQPYEGAYKVFIFDGADALSPDAANRLLKTLEEPPASVCLILLAVNEGAILETILSRCQTFRLRPISRAKIEVHLQAAYQVPKEKAALLAAAADGSIGWAIQAAQDDGLLEARRTEVDQIVALTGLAYHDRLDTARVLAEEFGRKREDGYHWLELVMQFWRDVVLVKGTQDAAVVNADRRETLGRLADALNFEEIGQALKQVERTAQRLQANANVRLALDVLMLNLPVVPAPERQGVA